MQKILILDTNKISVQTFNDLASLYAEKYMDLTLYNDTYDEFLTLLREKAKVLELGSGPGNVSKYLIAKRPDLEILATDAAPDMIKAAGAIHPNIRAELMDARELNRHKFKYDGVVAGFCLPYLSNKECMKLFGDVNACLNDGGLFYVSVIDGDYKASGKQTSATTGRSVYQYYYREADLEKMWGGRFSVIRGFSKSMALPNGQLEKQLILVFRKI